MFVSRRLIFLSVSSLVVVVVLFLAIYSLCRYPIERIDFLDFSSQNRDNEKVRAVLKNVLNQSWLLLDTTSLEKKIKTLAWVSSVSVSKSGVIGELLVDIEESVPAFRWQKGYLISSAGEIMHVGDVAWAEYASLTQVESSTENIMILGDIKQVVARIPKDKMGDLQKVRIGLYQDIELFFEKHTLIVDKDTANERLSNFVRWLKKLPRSLLRKGTIIDLRYADGFAVRYP